MKKSIRMAVIGGDLRQLVAARELAANGLQVVIYGFDDYEGNYGGIRKVESLSASLVGTDCVLLPLPFSRDGEHLNCPLTSGDIRVSEILATSEPNAMIFSGMMKGSADARVIDYYDREEFSVLNAIPTAEGALAIVMSELPITVHGMRVGITGFGRIGKTTAALFRAVGAHVTVFARSYEALAWAKAYSCSAKPLARLREEVHALDCLINTVPTVIVDAAILEKMRQDTLIVDLASAPGGVDFCMAEKLGLRAIPALSLPGKASPDTAGKIISETILNILSEKGVI